MKGFWICQRCNYQEPISKYKQSSIRYCPQCFRERKEQVPMRKKESFKGRL